MDENLHQGDEPEQGELTQLEREPGPRADPLFDRQTDETEFASRWFRARLRSNTPTRSPTSTAIAVTKLVLAAGLPAAGVVAGGWAMRVAGGLILTLAVVVFVLVGGVGLFLILRIEQHTREINDGEDGSEGGEVDPRRAGRGGRHARRQTGHPGPVRPRGAVQPPGRR
ncbi:MAG: hypothetical protein M3460_11945 [Actinomycetota bacterium]|nr:hypothetical protein [Actinomycetota bacterium]